MMATPTKLWMRLARRLGRDGNPLRRRSDRIEAWLLPVVLTLFVLLSPLIVLAASTWVHGQIAAAQRIENSYHHVPATLLAAAPGPEEPDGGANTWFVPTNARWTYAGHVHISQILAPANSPAHKTVSIVVNRAGQFEPPFPTAGQIRARVFETAVGAVVAFGVILSTLGWVVRRILDRHRIASWEVEWLSVGPQWSGRP